jgi:TolB protein
MKKSIFVITVLALALASCSGMPRNMDVPQSPLLRVLERKSGLIAYVGTDGNVYVSDQGGGNMTQLTDDAQFTEGVTGGFLFYQYPTWSTDGTKLAFASLAADSRQGADVTSQIYIADVEQALVEEVYESGLEHPFYLQWSPNNKDLGFLSTAANPDMLILQSVSAEGGERVILDSGAPYYWTWAPDGSVMLVHAGGSASGPEHLAFLQTDPDITEDGLEWQPATFQTPAWSPDGGHILVAEAGENGEKQIVLTDATGASRQAVGTYETNTAFAWASHGEKFAYIAGEDQLSAGTLGALHVRDVASDEDLVLDKKIISFFWSPDGEEIAYFIPLLTSAAPADGQSQTSEPVLLLELNVLDVATGESRLLFTYKPSEQFLAILPYFDQYHQSVTIWSPDNNNLVLSFSDDQGNSGIAVVAASGQLEPRFLAEGVLAFWSWQ